MLTFVPSIHRTTAIAVLTLLSGYHAAGQAQAFTAGNLLVSRTVYAGSSSTVSVGQSLPGGGSAVASGSFPDVFKNESVDPSFGITTPIYIDQITTSGSHVSTTAIDSSLITSSFASKSELSLNLSADGTAVTFMGYQAPANTLDVSNANTPGHVDPTNGVTSSYQRAIGQLNANGSVQVTGVNAYSGNNGRAAILANGNYYMVGNAGNSGTDAAKSKATGNTLSMLSDNTGVQMIAAGSSGNTTVVGTVNGTYGSTTGYQRGFSVTQVGAAADKTGKDDNFRGMTVFNNTLYVTKGSGGNGVNTVYQVGKTGELPLAVNAMTTDITPLPGFPTTLASSTSATHPFGIWFGDSSTLFVADEGSGTLTDKNAGLEEFKFDGSKWNLAATFQDGLLNQSTYSNGLPWNVYTSGLRNLTGRKNADGTFDIWATTATYSDETTHDQGADPNELVHTTVNGTSATTFNIVQLAAAGERIGGVSFAPTAAVPEPETYALLLAGVAALTWHQRKQRGTQRN